MADVTYTVPNISCVHCVHTIESELGQLSGVRRVEADLVGKKVTVSFEPPLTEVEIVALLKDINYAPAAS